jgi:hypothetical protein
VIQSQAARPGARASIIWTLGDFLESQKIATAAARKKSRSAQSKGSAVWAKANAAKYVNHVLSKIPTSMAPA